MRTTIPKLTLTGLLATVSLITPLCGQVREAHLTGITVFSLGPGATYDGVNGWDTVPTLSWAVTSGASRPAPNWMPFRRLPGVRMASPTLAACTC